MFEGGGYIDKERMDRDWDPILDISDKHMRQSFRKKMSIEIGTQKSSSAVEQAHKEQWDR